MLYMLYQYTCRKEQGFDGTLIYGTLDIALYSSKAKVKEQRGYKSLIERIVEIGQCFYFRFEGAASMLVPSPHDGAPMDVVEIGCLHSSERT
jgi:hypothetical protein